MNHFDRQPCYFFFLLALLLTSVVYLASCAEGAEPDRLHFVRVTVKTDTTINSGYGAYLGRGVVVVASRVTHGSLNKRARVTFEAGRSYLGTIVSEDKKKGVSYIKLDHLPDHNLVKLVGQYHQRKRTARFYRRVV